MTYKTGDIYIGGWDKYRRRDGEGKFYPANSNDIYL